MPATDQHDGTRYREVERIADCDRHPAVRWAARPLAIAEPVSFGEHPDTDLQQLRVLRELTEHAVRLWWHIRGVPLVDARDLVHLVPPVAGTGDPDDTCAVAWRRAYRYGTFHYRRGPGFVTVKDVRPDGPQANFIIDGAGHRLFLELARGELLSELSPDTTAALDTAVEAGLAVRGQRRYLVLPHRMRHWPVPYTAI